MGEGGKKRRRKGEGKEERARKRARRSRKKGKGQGQREERGPERSSLRHVTGPQMPPLKMPGLGGRVPFLLLIRYQLLVMLSWEHLCQATAEFKSVMNLPFRASQAAVLLCPASLPLFPPPSIRSQVGSQRRPCLLWAGLDQGGHGLPDYAQGYFFPLPHSISALKESCPQSGARG